MTALFLLEKVVELLSTTFRYITLFLYERIVSIPGTITIIETKLIFLIFSTHYSVRNAVTGSSCAAFLDGISPPRSVSNTLSTTRITAPATGKTALIVALPEI